MAGPVATFTADFTKWDAALKNAQANLKTFEVTTKNVSASLQRMASSLDGTKIMREAKTAAAAVEAIGGAARLTATEQKRVNAVVTEAIAKYRALGQEAPKQLRDLAAATTAVEKPTTSAVDSVKKLALSYISVAAAIGLAKSAFTTLVDFVQSSVKAYGEAEAAQKKVTAALTAQGNATPRVISQYSALATQFQKTTAFSDDLVQEMQALFIQVGNVGPAQMEKALTAATDLAAGLGVDLRTATLLVAKALEGNTGALGRYGIQIDKAKVAAEGASAVFEAINDRFGGQAQAQLDTYAGKLEQLTNNWNNFQEAVGKVVVTNELTTFAMNRMAEAMQRLSDGSEDATVSIGAWFQRLGGDTTTATYIALLEDYLGLLNNIDSAQRNLAKSPGLPQPAPLPAITGGLEEFERQNKALDEAAAKAKTAAKAIQELQDRLTGVKGSQDLERLLTAWNRTAPAIQKTTAAQDAFLDEYLQIAPAATRVNPKLEQSVRAMNALALAAGKFSTVKVIAGLKSLEGIGETIRDEFTDIFTDLLALEDQTIDQLAEQWRTADILGGLGLKSDVEREFIGTALDLQQRLDGIQKTGNQRQLVELQLAKAKELQVLRAAFGEQTAEYRQFAAIVEQIYAAQAKQIPTTFGSHLAGGMKKALAQIPQIIVDGLIHGASGQDIAIAIGSTLGAGIGEAIGTAIGGVFGGPLGAAAGAAIGAGIGKLVDFAIKTNAEQIRNRVAREFGVTISEGLAQGIEDLAKSRFAGERAAAQIFALGDIIKEGGGLSERNLSQMFARLHDVFSMVETGAFSASEATQVLDQTFRSFADFVTRNGALASRELLEIIRLNDQFGTSSAAVADFVNQNVQRALGGLTTFLTNAQVSSQAAAEAIGTSVFAAFEALQRQGATPFEALKAVTPILDQLQAQLQKTGFTGGAAFDEIRRLAALAGDAVAGPLIQGILGLNDAFAGLHNAGLLTQETFAGLAQQVGDTYAKLVAAGKGGAQSLQLIAPTLQTLFELQQQFGYEVDAATQRLIDQGKAAGLVGEQHKSAQEQMLDALNRTADAVTYLAEAFGFVADEATSATNTAIKQFDHLADKAKASLDAIPDNLQIKIRYRYETSGEPPPGSGDYAPAGHQEGGVFSKPHLAYVAEGGEAEIIGSIGFMTRALTGALSRVSTPAAGPASVVVVPVVIRGQPEATDVEAILAALVRAEPRIAGNLGGVRTSLRRGIGV